MYVYVTLFKQLETFKVHKMSEVLYLYSDLFLYYSPSMVGPSSSLDGPNSSIGWALRGERVGMLNASLSHHTAFNT